MGDFEFPEFLKGKIIHSSRLVQSKNLWTTLVLLENLNFYEFDCKTLTNSINLSTTVFKKIESKLKDYKEATEHCGVIKKSSESENELILRRPNFCKEIMFGKFIYQNFDYKKIYILIKCFDKMVILYRNESEGFHLEAEYENVNMFKHINGKLKYQAQVAIYLNEDGMEQVIRRDFNESVENEKKLLSEDESIRIQNSTEVLKKVFDKIKVAKTELYVHRAITRNSFNKLKVLDTFGSNYTRSLKLEEKIIVSRCGDVWFRITSTDDFVIGVPIISNSSSPRLTALRNVYPVIKLNETSELQYDFRIFHLGQDSDIESLETFFRYQDQRERWIENTEHILFPESYSLLLIKLKISSIILHYNRNSHYPLFLFYDVILHENGDKPHISRQQCFLKNMNFDQLLQNPRQFNIEFKENTLHQDLLAVTATSEKLHLIFEYTNSADLEEFEKTLEQKFNFIRILRRENKESTNEEELFFNKIVESIWHSTLVVKGRELKSREKIIVNWKFFTSSIDKSILLIRLIFREMILIGCNVQKIRLMENNFAYGKACEFEDSLRKELHEIINSIRSYDRNRNLSNSSKTQFLLELETDKISTTINIKNHT